MESEKNILGVNDDSLTFVSYLVCNDHNEECSDYSTQLYKEYSDHKDHLAKTYYEAMEQRFTNYKQNLEATGNVFENGQSTQANDADNLDFRQSRKAIYPKESKRARNNLKKQNFKSFQQTLQAAQNPTSPYFIAQ